MGQFRSAADPSATGDESASAASFDIGVLVVEGPVARSRDRPPVAHDAKLTEGRLLGEEVSERVWPVSLLVELGRRVQDRVPFELGV